MNISRRNLYIQNKISESQCFERYDTVRSLPAFIMDFREDELKQYAKFWSFEEIDQNDIWRKRRGFWQRYKGKRKQISFKTIEQIKKQRNEKSTSEGFSNCSIDENEVKNIIENQKDRRQSSIINFNDHVFQIMNWKKVKFQRKPAPKQVKPVLKFTCKPEQEFQIEQLIKSKNCFKKKTSSKNNDAQLPAPQPKIIKKNTGFSQKNQEPPCRDTQQISLKSKESTKTSAENKIEKMIKYLNNLTKQLKDIVQAITQNAQSYFKAELQIFKDRSIERQLDHMMRNLSRIQNWGKEDCSEGFKMERHSNSFMGRIKKNSNSSSQDQDHCEIQNNVSRKDLANNADTSKYKTESTSTHPTLKKVSTKVVSYESQVQIQLQNEEEIPVNSTNNLCDIRNHQFSQREQCYTEKYITGVVQEPGSSARRFRLSMNLNNVRPKNIAIKQSSTLVTDKAQVMPIASPFFPLPSSKVDGDGTCSKSKKDLQHSFSILQTAIINMKQILESNNA